MLYYLEGVYVENMDVLSLFGDGRVSFFLFLFCWDDVKG